MVVVALDPEGIKVAEVLTVEEEILGVEVDVVMVMGGHKKQTLCLTGIRAKSLPNRFSIVPNLHLLWNRYLAMSGKVVI